MYSILTDTTLGAGRIGCSRSSVCWGFFRRFRGFVLLILCTVPHGTSDGHTDAKLKRCILVNGLEPFCDMKGPRRSFYLPVLAEYGNDRSKEWFLVTNAILSVIPPIIEMHAVLTSICKMAASLYVRAVLRSVQSLQIAQIPLVTLGLSRKRILCIMMG